MCWMCCSRSCPVPDPAGGRAYLVVNPRSGGGRTARRLPAIRAAAARCFDEVELGLSQAPGDAARLAQEAARQGHRLIVAVGGDGTVHEVVNGLVDAEGQARTEAVLAVLPAGTGSDLARSLGLPSDIDEAMAVASQGRIRRIDLCLLSTRGEDRQDRLCVGVNLCGIGLNGAVVRRVAGGRRWGGGKRTYLAASIRALARYRPTPLRMRWLGPEGAEGGWEGDLLAGFLANGRWCGGGLDVGREIDPTDGLLDLVLLPGLGVGAAMRLLRGERIAGLEGAVHRRVRALEVHSTRVYGVPVDIDGEVGGRLPLAARLLPAALPVRGVW